MAAAGSSATDIWAVGETSLRHYDGVSWTAKNTGIDTNRIMRSVFPLGPTTKCRRYSRS